MHILILIANKGSVLNFKILSNCIMGIFFGPFSIWIMINYYYYHYYFLLFLRGGGGPQDCALCLSLCEHRRWDQWENWLMKSPLRSCRAASTFLKTAATSGRGLAGKSWTGVVKIKAILHHNVCKYCTETVIVLSILRFILLLKYLCIFNLSVFLRLEFEYKIASMQYYLMYANKHTNNF